MSVCLWFSLHSGINAMDSGVEQYKKRYESNYRYGMVHMNSLSLYFMLFMIFAGWLGVLITYLVLPYSAMNHDPDDVFVNDKAMNPKFDRPFWYIASSLIIVFAIFFMLVSSLVFIDTKHMYGDNNSDPGSLFSELKFSFSFVMSRINIFFSETFLMIIFMGFIYLNFKFYDDIKGQMNIANFNYSAILLCISTGLQVLIFFYSYIVQRDVGPESRMLDNLPLLRNMFFPLRMLQLQMNRPNSKRHVEDGMRYLNTLLIIVSLSSLTLMYVTLKFYMTDG